MVFWPIQISTYRIRLGSRTLQPLKTLLLRLKSQTIVRFGWLPGVAYWFSHTETVPPTPIGWDNSNTGNRPRSEGIRRIIADLARTAGVIAPVVASATHVETPLLVTPDKKKAIVTLLNFSPGLPVPRVPSLQLEVRLPFIPTTVESVEHGALTFTTATSGTQQHIVNFTVPALTYGDFVAMK